MVRKGNQPNNGVNRATFIPDNKGKTRALNMDGGSLDPSVPGSLEQRDDKSKHSLDNSGHHCPQDSVSNSGNGVASHPNSDNVGGQRGVLHCWIAASVSSILIVAMQWLEKQKPVVDKLVQFSDRAHEYVRTRTEYVYPIIGRWAVHTGRFLLFLSMLWLDCSLRGLESLLRMGTMSFLAVIWCSSLSIMAMVGIYKFSILLVSAALLAIFISFGLSLLFTLIVGIVVLYLYGSFWTTTLIILCAGIAYGLSHERITLSVLTIYSIFCAKGYVGWLGLLAGLNLSFFSSDLLIFLLRSNLNEHGSNNPQNQFRQTHVDAQDAFQNDGEGLANRGHGMPSTSGVEMELMSGDEINRLLNCKDHYSALGLSRYGEVDAVYLKREYKKKAMLVHPDKNWGNERAAEAFKKLQNAYEVLLDSLKRKAYDDELRREDIINIFRGLQNSNFNNGRHGLFPSEHVTRSTDNEDLHMFSRRIACKKCNNFHTWILTEKLKSQSRWCQECKEFHQAKDGDGWVEQSFYPLFFGLLQKADIPHAYVCSESRVYDATEWFICQGMACPANAHKPSFHVNTSIASKQSNSKGSNSSHKGKGSAPIMEDTMTEEGFFEWLQNAVQSGSFASFDPQHTPSTNSPTGRSASSKGGSAKKKRKGKKQW